MAAPQIESGVYYIQNVGTGTVLDLAGGSNEDNTKLQGWEKRELSDPLSPVQLWIISEVGNGMYTIQNTSSRTFADIPSSDVTSGTPIVGYHQTGNASQQWVITRNTKKTAYIIKNSVTGTYIDLYGGFSGNGSAVEGFANDGSGAGTINTHQLWHIVRA